VIRPVAKTKAGKFEIVTFEAADERLDGALADTFQGDYATVLLFAGDLEVTGDSRRRSATCAAARSR